MTWFNLVKEDSFDRRGPQFPLPGEKQIIDMLLQNYRVHIIMLEKMENECKQLKQHMNEGNPDTIASHFESMQNLMADVEGGSELWKERHEGIRTQLGRT